MDMKTESNATINPFFGIEIGSIVRSSQGKFLAPVIKSNAKISRMLVDKEVKRTMTGQSSYAYTDSLNQASMGVSGSYGTSAISKFNSGISVHAGNSKAVLKKQVTVNFNVQMLSGVEFINFNDLQVDDLINSLQGNPKQMILDILEKYNKLSEKLKDRDLLILLEDSEKHNEIVDLVEAWVQSVQKFFREHGDGLVIGVVWGGMGSVTLKMSNTANENNWKYGGKGNFTYAKTGASVSVEAAYDGSNSQRSSNVQVETLSWSSGGCVKDQINKWSEVVENKAFSEICEMKLLEKAPKIGDVKDPPAIPSFLSPKKDPKVTDKIANINSLEGLEAFAKASAYEKAKKDNPDLTLDEFLRQANQQVHTDEVENLQDQVVENDLDTLSEEEDIIPPPNNLNELVHQQLKSAKPNSDYTALGVWITNWSDLFPWLATGYLNQMDHLKSTLDIIKKQCMIQDFLCLGKIYYTLGSSNIKCDSFGISSFDQLAQSYSQQAGNLRDNFGKKNILQETFDQLSEEAQKIYTKWNDIRFLRNAELGLGVLLNITDTADIQGKSIADTIKKSDRVGGYTRVFYEMKKCTFSVKNKNHVAFSSFLKVLPFITPTGEIYAFGPSDMLLRGINETNAWFCNNPIGALKLEVDRENKVLKNGGIVLHSLKFSSAKDIGSSWKGQSLSTNVGSIKNINNHIENTIKEIQKLNTYSFSSSNWDPNWKPQNFFGINKLKKQYVGIVDEPRNVFE